MHTSKRSPWYLLSIFLIKINRDKEVNRKRQVNSSMKSGHIPDKLWTPASLLTRFQCIIENQ